MQQPALRCPPLVQLLQADAQPEGWRGRRGTAACKRCHPLMIAALTASSASADSISQDEYQGSHWIDYEKFSTRGSISVHINANRRGRGRLRAWLGWQGRWHRRHTRCACTLCLLAVLLCPGVRVPLPPAFREGNGKRYDHWIDYAVGW